MALSQFEVFDPDGELIGTYEVRANAETAIQNDIQAKAGGYVISDEKFRAQEAAEQAEARVREREGALAAEKKVAAAEKQAVAEAKAAHERDRALIKEAR